MEELSDRLINAINAMFGSNEHGDISCRQSKKHYPFLGSAYRLRLPTIFSGNLYASEIRVSHAGFIMMDDDESTAVDGLNQYMIPSPYYLLDNGTDAMQALAEDKLSLDRRSNIFLRTLLLEKFSGFLSLPILIFNAIVVFTFGLHSK